MRKIDKEGTEREIGKTDGVRKLGRCRKRVGNCGRKVKGRADLKVM